MPSDRHTIDEGKAERKARVENPNAEWYHLRPDHADREHGHHVARPSVKHVDITKAIVCAVCENPIVEVDA